jgi:16S rRNA (cytosine1407-C5)-methyltransferase
VDADTFRSRLYEIVGETDASRVAQALSSPRRTSAWINRLRYSGDDPTLLARIGCDLTPVGLDGVYSAVPAHRDTVMRSSEAADGLVYPTNPSSVLAARALDALPGEEVLDLAAAPGGKTLQLAAMMQNRGRIAAVEAIKPRFYRMRANLERCGVTIAEFYLADGRTIGRKVPQRFARVLLDAPCSSEARIRLDDPRTFAHWSPRKIRECARKQRALIASAYAALAPGGVLVYSTCSFAPEENELVIARLLERTNDAEIEALPPDLLAAVPSLSRRPGLTRWEDRDLDPRLSRALRILPDETWDGFFVCRIRKTSGAHAT